MSGKSKKIEATPFVKWAGGKAQMLNEIRAKYPAALGASVCKYAEPFVGGGAVLFDALKNYTFREIYISDINWELIRAYTAIRDGVNELIDTLDGLGERYLAADAEARKKMYYAERERFNALKAACDTSIELAALFIFLNRTCFNGLYRVNSKGAFNVPQGDYIKPKICDADNLRAVSSVLHGATIVCGDYKLSRDFIDDKTFAYFDPPYRSLTSEPNFISSARDGFCDESQAELARFIDEISKRGAWFVSTYSDTNKIGANGEYFDGLYANYSIYKTISKRIVNQASERKFIQTWIISRGQ
jgi:DNA adenine methylase